MKLKPLLIFTILMIPCLFILQSCNPLGTRDDEEPCKDKKEYRFLNKDAMPYTGNDTISMVSNTGDTINCIGGGTQPFTTSHFVLAPNPACGNHGTEYIHEANKINYVDSLKSTTILVS
jgi:hypothetical protein